MARNPFRAGWEVIGDFCRALGIDPDVTPVQKIVMEVTCDSIPRFWVQGVADGEQCKQVVSATAALFPVAEVTVDEQGTVDPKPVGSIIPASKTMPTEVRDMIERIQKSALKNPVPPKPPEPPRRGPEFL